jgi:hypothetical protein
MIIDYLITNWEINKDLQNQEEQVKACKYSKFGNLKGF